jgi:hypothetical protein
MAGISGSAIRSIFPKGSDDVDRFTKSVHLVLQIYRIEKELTV